MLSFSTNHKDVMISWLCNLYIKEHMIPHIPYCEVNQDNYHHLDVSRFK